MPHQDYPQDPSKNSEPTKDEDLVEEKRAASREQSSSASSAAIGLPPIPLTQDTITFRDAGGALWWAHEVSGEALGAPGQMCLLLICGTKLRRIWTYPPDWRSLTPEELLALPESAD